MNRRMRTRMSGGVGGRRGEPASYPINQCRQIPYRRGKEIIWLAWKDKANGKTWVLLSKGGNMEDSGGM